MVEVFLSLLLARKLEASWRFNYFIRSIAAPKVQPHDCALCRFSFGDNVSQVLSVIIGMFDEPQSERMFSRKRQFFSRKEVNTHLSPERE